MRWKGTQDALDWHLSPGALAAADMACLSVCLPVSRSLSLSADTTEMETLSSPQVIISGLGSFWN